MDRGKATSRPDGFFVVCACNPGRPAGVNELRERPKWAQRKRSSGAERASQRNASTPTSSAGRTRSIVPFALLWACVKTTSFGVHTGAALHPLNSDSPGLDEWFREVTRGAREGHSEGCDDGRCGAARGCVTAGGEGLRSVDDDVPVWVSGGLRRSLARELRRVVATSLLGPLEGVGPVLVMGAGKARGHAPLRDSPRRAIGCR